MARNKYRGVCYYCGETVEVGEGHFERDRTNGTWRTIHATCVFKQREEKGKIVTKKPFRRYSRNGKNS